MAKLKVLQSVWGLDRCPGFDIENALDDALAQVVSAGFDGVGVNLVRRERTAGVVRAMNPLGLAWEAQVLAHDAAQLAGFVNEAQRLGAHHLNVQIAGPVADLDRAVALVEAMLEVAGRASLPVWFETHRGRLTNDLLFTLRLMEACPALRLTADLSHYPVAGEMELPLRDDQRAAIETILQRSDNFHGRISSTHQVQVALDAPQHRGWRDQHVAWWRRGFELWLARSGTDDALTFMCELGPPPYAITAPDGHELTNRWDEARRMQDIVRDLWREVNGAD